MTQRRQTPIRFLGSWSTLLCMPILCMPMRQVSAAACKAQEIMEAITRLISRQFIELKMMSEIPDWRLKVWAAELARRTDVVLGASFEAKIRLALKSELISDPNAAFIRAIAKLRNFYAHNVSNMPKKIREAAELLDRQGNGLSLMRDLMASAPNAKKRLNSKLAYAYLQPLCSFALRTCLQC